MKISVLMGREPSYTRNRVILDGLAAAGIEVEPYLDCGRNYPLRFVRVLSRFAFGRARHSDAVLVGFFGQPFMPIVRLLTSKPVVLDAFLSGYDTMCFDRKRFKPRSLAGRLFYWLDRSACLKADLVLLDTERHIDYFAETFGVDRSAFRRVYVGAETGIFNPSVRSAGVTGGPFEVFYYCTYHPLHGTEYVVRAAHLLKDHPDIRFTIVGTGQEKRSIEALARELELDNTDFIEWLEYDELPGAIAGAGVCLGGHFAPVEKAGRVIAGKSFQFLAMRKPVIVGDNAANRELLTHRHDAYMVPMADAQALAAGILELKEDPVLRDRIADNGYLTFLASGTPEVIGGELSRLFADLLE